VNKYSLNVKFLVQLLAIYLQVSTSRTFVTPAILTVSRVPPGYPAV